MGKYMRKTKVSGELAVMEVPHQSPLGVRTRARTRTLALQRLHKPQPDPATPSSYLQLRNRRLEKSTPPPPPLPSPPGPRAPVNSGSGGSVSVRRCSKSAATTETETDGGVEVSFGENVLDVEDRDRNVRETTPCSLIRDSETVRTPGSTTRPANSTATNRRMQNSTHTNIPTACEMEEFFARAEQLQQRIFMDKYNFDPVNDCPLPGRYEWVKLDCLGSTSSSGNSFPAASPSVSAQDFERR